MSALQFSLSIFISSSNAKKTTWVCEAAAEVLESCKAYRGTERGYEDPSAFLHTSAHQLGVCLCFAAYMCIQTYLALCACNWHREQKAKWGSAYVLVDLCAVCMFSITNILPIRVITCSVIMERISTPVPVIHCQDYLKTRAFSNEFFMHLF